MSSSSSSSLVVSTASSNSNNKAAPQRAGAVCSGCNLEYSAAVAQRAPRSLPCAHTYCTLCLTTLLLAAPLAFTESSSPSATVPRSSPQHLHNRAGSLADLAGASAGRVVSCPTCAVATTLTSTDASLLPLDYALLGGSRPLVELSVTTAASPDGSSSSPEESPSSSASPAASPHSSESPAASTTLDGGAMSSSSQTQGDAFPLSPFSPASPVEPNQAFTSITAPVSSVTSPSTTLATLTLSTSTTTSSPPSSTSTPTSTPHPVPGSAASMMAGVDAAPVDVVFSEFPTALSASSAHERRISKVPWMPDVAAPRCTTCRRDFTVLFRRHHCRRCGLVVCRTCSSHKAVLAGARSPVRVCDTCLHDLSANVKRAAAAAAAAVSSSLSSPSSPSSSATPAPTPVTTTSGPVHAFSASTLSPSSFATASSSATFSSSTTTTTSSSSASTTVPMTAV